MHGSVTMAETYTSSLDQNGSRVFWAATAINNSDHADDVAHRKSVTGVVLKLAGGDVLYKTAFQATVAHSSTESEFTAAADAAKYIPYLHTLLEEIGLSQHDATILYEDNQGALFMAKSETNKTHTTHGY